MASNVRSATDYEVWKVRQALIEAVSEARKQHQETGGYLPDINLHEYAQAYSMKLQREVELRDQQTKKSKAGGGFTGKGEGEQSTEIDACVTDKGLREAIRELGGNFAWLETTFDDNMKHLAQARATAERQLTIMEEQRNTHIKQIGAQDRRFRSLEAALDQRQDSRQQASTESWDTEAASGTMWSGNSFDMDQSGRQRCNESSTKLTPSFGPANMGMGSVARGRPTYKHNRMRQQYQPFSVIMSKAPKNTAAGSKYFVELLRDDI